MKKKTIAFMLVAVIVMSLTGCKNDDYKKAVELQEAGDYQTALELYENIEDYESYKDTVERIETCKAMLEAIESFNADQKFC